MSEKREDETQTAFAIRLIRAEAWDEGWDERSAYDDCPDPSRLNPYQD